MRIKVIASIPEATQTEIDYLIGKEFEATYKYWDHDIIREMRRAGEIGIIEEGQIQPIILNKNEYEVIG